FDIAVRLETPQPGICHTDKAIREDACRHKLNPRRHPFTCRGKSMKDQNASERAGCPDQGELPQWLLILGRLPTRLAHASETPSAAPNGLRLSGERSRAKRVRCSRGLGGCLIWGWLRWAGPSPVTGCKAPIEKSGHLWQT